MRPRLPLGTDQQLTQADGNPVISGHLDGSFNDWDAAMPVFHEQGGGSFVHMTSTSGLTGNFGQANHMAAKLGIAGLSRGIAVDMYGGPI